MQHLQLRDRNSLSEIYAGYSNAEGLNLVVSLQCLEGGLWLRGLLY